MVSYRLFMTLHLNAPKRSASTAPIHPRTDAPSAIEVGPADATADATADARRHGIRRVTADGNSWTLRRNSDSYDVIQ